MEDRPHDAEAQARELMLALPVRWTEASPCPLFEELPDGKLVLTAAVRAAGQP